MTMSFVSRFRNYWRERELGHEFDDELQFHLNARIQRNVSRGMTRRAAETEARRHLGNFTQAREGMRQARVMHWMDSVRQDLRFTVRSLMRNRMFAALATLTLAIGLGANIAAFSAFDAVLGRDLPVRDPERLVALHWLRSNDSMIAAYSGYGRPGPDGMGIRTSFSPITFERFRTSSHALSDVFAFGDRLTLTVTVDGFAEAASAQVVSGNYYSALGVPAFRGRVLTDGDDRADAPAVAVMTYRYWQRRFAGDPNVIGRTIVANGSPLVIVGVTPEGFDGTLATETSDLTIPIAHASLAEENGRAKPRSTWSLRIMGRLKDDASLEQVEPDLRQVFEDSVRESWAMRLPDTPNPTRSGMPALRAVSGRQGPDGPLRDALADLAIALAVGGAILVIGCANVANLVLVRGLKRRREIAVRLALGASRARLIALLLAESLVLSIAGGSLGVVLAYWGKDFLTWLPASSTLIVAPVIDARVLAFSVLLSIVTAILFGLVPALRATRSQPGRDMKRRGWRRLPGRAMVVVQVAGCVVLLAAAALAVRTVHNLNTVDLGFDPEDLIVFRLAVPDDDAARIPSPYDVLAEGLAAAPGVKAVTFSSVPLVARTEWTETIQPEGDSASRDVHVQVVGSNFFQALGIPVLSGRDFSAEDRRGAVPVALINQQMAAEVFGNTPPVGRYFRMLTGSPKNVPIQVVGIVGDTKGPAVAAAAPPTLYLRASQTPRSAVTFHVRTSAEPGTLMRSVRDVVAQILPGVAMVGAKTQQQQIEDTLARPRGFAMVTAVFGFVAVLLACLGVYGVVSYDVNQRQTELAVRVALGATPSQLLRLVTRDVLVVVTVGCGVGTGIAVSAMSIVQQLLYGVSPSDPVTFATAVVAFTMAALAAAAPAAWRASHLSPVEGLKQD
jgi:predicted permease